MRPVTRTGLLLFILLLTLALPVAVGDGHAAETAEEPQPDTASADAGEHDNADVPSPANVVNEMVIVEGSLPYVPTSNMIGTHLPIPLRWIPANLGTVTEFVIREQRAFVLGETLKNVSGVHAQTQSGVADFFSVRGYDSLSGALVTTDGAPEPEVSFYQTYNVERIEVLKGPGGFLHGRTGLSGALAGTVNIVRRQPEPVTFAAVGGSFGSYGTYQGNLDYNFAPDNSDRFSFRLNALYRESEGYRDDKQNETVALNPAFAWRIGDNTTLNVNLEYLDIQHQPDSGIPLLNNQIPDVDPETGTSRGRIRS